MKNVRGIWKGSKNKKFLDFLRALSTEQFQKIPWFRVFQLQYGHHRTQHHIDSFNSFYNRMREPTVGCHEICWHCEV